MYLEVTCTFMFVWHTERSILRYLTMFKNIFVGKLKFLPEELPFLDGFLYNNYMFMMAGHVAEKLGQDTWESLMESKVLQPLGMNHAKFMTMPSVVEDHTARPYVYLKKSNEFVNGTLELYS